MEDLIKYGEVRRGTILGISLQPLTTYYAEQLRAPNTRGVLVVEVDQRSDAYQAGLRPGDIIVGFDTRTVDDASQFIRVLSDARIGSTATLGILRQGRQTTVKVPIVQASGRARRR
jgi:serine protease Do